MSCNVVKIFFQTKFLNAQPHLAHSLLNLSCKARSVLRNSVKAFLTPAPFSHFLAKSALLSWSQLCSIIFWESVASKLAEQTKPINPNWLLYCQYFKANFSLCGYCENAPNLYQTPIHNLKVFITLCIYLKDWVFWLTKWTSLQSLTLH